RRLFLLFCAHLIIICNLYSQDPLAEHRIRGLKGVRSVALVFQPSDKFALVTTKELADIMRVVLARDIRRVSINEHVETAPIWLTIALAYLPMPATTP